MATPTEFEQQRTAFLNFLETRQGRLEDHTTFLSALQKHVHSQNLDDLTVRVARAWLGIERAIRLTELQKQLEEYADFRVPVQGMDFVYRWRAPLVLTEDAGWVHEGRFEAAMAHPVTGEHTAGLQTDGVWRFLNAQMGLGATITTDYYGGVNLIVCYDSERWELNDAVKTFRALIEEPNPFRGQVCRYDDDGLSVINLPEETISAYEDGVEDAVTWLTTIADQKVQERLSAAGLPLRAGLLLEGPPGSGKTTLVRRIARDLPGETTVIYVGADSDVQEAFDFALNFKPVLIIFEDIESFVGTRGDREFTVFLNAVDGLTQTSPIMILATTNDSSQFDQAVRRAGRLERRVVIKSVHPDAKIDMVRSRFPEESKENIENILVAIEDRCEAMKAALTPAIIDSLCRHVIMLGVDSADICDYTRNIWEPVWEGSDYLE